MGIPTLNKTILKTKQADLLAMRRIKRIHFVGIGGAGMGGIAEVLLTQGFDVTGSDLHTSPMTERLQTLGARIFHGHHASHIQGCDVVVTSSAIAKDNPEIVAAHEARVPVVPRAEMLSELMRFRYGIAVAGTHGKTTTTSLLASLLAQGGLDPTFVIGGLLNSAGSNAKLGASPYLVAEADESDGSFLLLNPTVAIITNIDRDHLSTYAQDFEKLKKTFVEFVHRLPFYGLVVACMDCEIVRALIPELGRPVLTYGYHEEADFRIRAFEQKATQSSFYIEHEKFHQALACELNLPGKHNAQNATAAVVVAYEEGISLPNISSGLKAFAGVGRRFDIYGDLPFESGKIMLVDDYGHHPAEIAATIQAARLAWPDRRLIMIFQPHRFSRTHDLFEDFVACLSKVDQLFVLEVYSAGEKPIVGADGRALCGAIRARKEVDPIFVPEKKSLPMLMKKHLKPNDVLITQGAGDTDKLCKMLYDDFRAPFADAL